MLTRSQMEQVIREGGSVLHGGRIITRMEHLPTDADLAVGNPEQEAAAATALEAQIAALQAQHARLTQSRTVRTGQGQTVLAGPAATPPPQYTGGTWERHELLPGESPEEAAARLSAPPALADIVGQEQAERLAAASYSTPESVAAARDEQLLAISGIGPATLRQLRTAYGGGA